MFRNLFVLFSTLMLGASAASPSTGDATKLPLKQRIEAAQKTIDTLMDAEKDQASKPHRDRVAAWHNWNNYGGGPWSNWHNGFNQWSKASNYLQKKRRWGEYGTDQASTAKRTTQKGPAMIDHR